MASSLRSSLLARNQGVDPRAKARRAPVVVRASAPQQQPPNGARSTKPGPARAAYTAEYVSARNWNAPAQAPLQQHLDYAWGASPAAHGLKDSLLQAVDSTKRGALTTRDRRGEVEELQVALESFQGAQDLDYSLLPGLWELKYTTSEEVIPIINWGNMLSGFWGEGPLRTGKIFQRFSEPDADGKGRLDNIVLFSLPLLEERQGVRLTVNIDYTVRSGHMLDLEFNTANFTNVRVSEQLEALLAPAALPRLPFQAELLTAIRGINLRLPFRQLTEITGPIWEQVGREDHLGTATGPYQLTYLDDDMLIGRAVTLGSSFIFTRAEEFKN